MEKKHRRKAMTIVGSFQEKRRIKIRLKKSQNDDQQLAISLRILIILYYFRKIQYIPWRKNSRICRYYEEKIRKKSRKDVNY